jgi:nicotinamidase-related amidase
MTNLSERPNTALLVIDVQNNVVAKVGRARAARVPVIWVQHSDDNLTMNSDGWRYVPELQREQSEVLVHKQYGDSFEDTTLEAELKRLGVGRLIVTGAQTDACIRSTIHGAFARGYDTLLVSDAHTTDDLSEYGLPSAEKVIAHTNMYWKWQAAPGRTAGVVETAQVQFGAP